MARVIDRQYVDRTVIGVDGGVAVEQLVISSDDDPRRMTRFDLAPPRHFVFPAVLLLLSEEQSYGYELVKGLRAFRFGTVDRPAVYRALAQLEKDGLVESRSAQSKAGTARRVYQLTEDGEIHTVEVNRELEEMLNSHFKSTNVENKIKLHFGEAEQVIGTLPYTDFDLVFIDADKKNNYTYFQIVIDKVRQGGLIIIDNVLWKGKVYGEISNDADTESIRKMNDRVAADDRVEKLILPVRDGLLLIRKK